MKKWVSPVKVILVKLTYNIRNTESTGISIAILTQKFVAWHPHLVHSNFCIPTFSAAECHGFSNLRRPIPSLRLVSALE